MENKDLIFNAICYAKKNFSDANMSVENVAEHAGFSIDYFNRIFLAHTGFTVMSYVNYMRIKKAETKLPVPSACASIRSPPGWGCISRSVFS